MRGRTTRREFLERGGRRLAGGALVGSTFARLAAQEPGARPRRDAAVEVLTPRGRVPVSLIIDDSTCLVNLAHFGIPQFHATFPGRYPQPWRKLPREIPDRFVIEFMDWCREHGVKGKYSLVPYPACVGWLDRELPGWSHRELLESLRVVREAVAPNWDIHPEMVSHTRVIDLRTGRPYPDVSDRFMENWRWTDGRSADELAAYMAYALRILKNVGLHSDGITTPGGFGNRVLPELARATLEACREVHSAEIPHYFRHLFTGEESVMPRVEYASGLEGPDPRCVVSIIGCTGDWFGGWDGLTPGSADRFIGEDLRGGRLPEVIARGEPAIMVCHWPGIWFNGKKHGFGVLQEVVRRLEAARDDLLWMNLSEISRWAAARETTATSVNRKARRIELRAPWACPDFTLRVAWPGRARPRLVAGDERRELALAPKAGDLRSGGWIRDGERVTLCFDLPRGASVVELDREGA